MKRIQFPRVDNTSKGGESCHKFLDIDIRALYSRTARKGVMILPDPAAGETCDTHSRDGQTP